MGQRQDVILTRFAVLLNCKGEKNLDAKLPARSTHANSDTLYAATRAAGFATRGARHLSMFRLVSCWCMYLCIYKLSHRLFFHALQQSCQKNEINSTRIWSPLGAPTPLSPRARGEGVPPCAPHGSCRQTGAPWARTL